MQDGRKENPVEQISRSIIRYLRTHPDACDTSSGILKWWLGTENQPASELEVRGALEYLLRAGKLLRTALAHGSELFAARQGRLTRRKSNA
ncbi:MAG: hypothetical protein KAY13_01185 [Zoogloea sp.]|nr:hypothetical protein [Zoogloea sp.]